MGGQSVFATPLDLWKERRLSALTSSTCGSFLSHSPEAASDHEMESVYTHRSSISSQPTGRTRSRSLRSLRMSLPIYEERDERSTLVQPPHADSVHHTTILDAPVSPVAKMFASSSIRVWKQTPLPNWMNVFVPRHVRLQTGSHPYLEYARHAQGAIRQRLYLTTASRLERLPKNKLQIEFNDSSRRNKSNCGNLVLDHEPLVSSSYDVSMKQKQAKRRIDYEPRPHSSCSSSRCSSTLKWTLRFETKQERDHWAKKIQDAIDLLAWIDKFTLGQILVHSAAATLAECFSWLDQGQPSYVIKAMSTESKKDTAAARNEIHVHHLLTNFSSHRNVLALHDSFRQQERAYLVLEYCGGGDLFEYLQKEGAVDEASAKVLFRCIAQAIAYIHAHNVVHLDIKPENLLFKNSSMDLESIKLADFGSALLTTADPTQSQRQTTVSCTVGYAAPEVLDRGEVSFAADVFSAGAVLFTLLGGYAPFQSVSDEETMDRTLRGDFSFDEPEWDHVSAQVKDLICGMLEVDPQERWSMQDVLQHPWLA